MPDEADERRDPQQDLDDADRRERRPRAHLASGRARGGGQHAVDEVGARLRGCGPGQAGDDGRLLAPPAAGRTRPQVRAHGGPAGRVALAVELGGELLAADGAVH